MGFRCPVHWKHWLVKLINLYHFHRGQGSFSSSRWSVRVTRETTYPVEFCNRSGSTNLRSDGNSTPSHANR